MTSPFVVFGFFGPSPAGLFLLVIPAAVLLGLILAISVFRYSAQLAGANHCSGSQAFLAILLGGITALITTVVFSLLPIIGTFLGIVCGFLLKAGITSAILGTTYGVGLLTELLYLVFGVLIVVAVVMAAVTVGGGMMVSLL
jgi:hypothetical protein